MTSLDEADLSRRLWEQAPSQEDQAMIDRLRGLESAHVHEGVAKRLDGIATEMIAAARAEVSGIIALVVGPTGAGKSHNLDRFAERPEFRAFERVNREGVVRPLVHIEAPKPCTLKSLGMHLWEELTGHPFHRVNPKEHAIWRAVMHQMNEQQVRVLVIDEFHHVIDGGNSVQRRQVTEILKSLSNRSPLVFGASTGREGVLNDKVDAIMPARPINVLLAGMPEIETVVAENRQFDRRKYYLKIAPVGEDAQGVKAMARFLRLMSEKVDLGADLSERDLPLRFRKASRGYLGMAAFLAKRAARRAFSHGRHSIDVVEDLGGIFEDITGEPPDRNPFLVANPSALRGAGVLTEQQMTRLKGSGAGS